MIKVIDMYKAVARNPLFRMAEPVTLSIDLGEQVAIVGDNGAGKSMLVDLITGAHPILTDGKGSYIRYDFTSAADRREDGCVGDGSDGSTRSNLVCDNIKYITFQDAYSTTSGNYYYQIRYNHTEYDEETQGLFRLSSGELRRYQLRKALENHPRVLILDNPFIGLDVDARRMLDETLSDLTQNTDLQVIVVLSKTDDMPSFVTHVVEVCDRRVGEKEPVSTFMPRVRKYDRMLSEEKEQMVLSCAVKSSAENAVDDTSDADDGNAIVAQFNNVCIKYPGRVILKDLSFTFRRGEHWALTGENGAGKSTLLSLVCADNPQAYANDIVLFGHRRGSGESIWDIKRHIGYVSPEMHRAFLRDYPAIDIVASGMLDSIGLFRKATPEAKEKALWWMKIFGVAQYADVPMLKLSSGEQRLVLLARTFVKAPSLLILDEPLHGLDLKNRRLVKDIIETYCSQPDKTLIMVSHYREEFPRCIDHEIFLKHL